LCLAHKDQGRNDHRVYSTETGKSDAQSKD
jgi:hypothetical protein